MIATLIGSGRGRPSRRAFSCFCIDRGRGKQLNAQAATAARPASRSRSRSSPRRWTSERSRTCCKPQQYAMFLDQEISFNGKQPLLVVMAAGYGSAGSRPHPPRRSARCPSRAARPPGRSPRTRSPCSRSWRRPPAIRSPASPPDERRAWRQLAGAADRDPRGRGGRFRRGGARVRRRAVVRRRSAAPAPRGAVKRGRGFTGRGGVHARGLRLSGEPAGTAALPRALVAEARPVGRGARFQPPARGPVTGRCTRRLAPGTGCTSKCSRPTGW